MPTERFYRLAKEKAETIRNAAIQEFKRVTPEEASINKIIQSAGISRGSFYTYFEDKYELLRWLLGDFVAIYQNFYVTELEKKEGNLWEVYEDVLDHTIEWVAAQGLVEIVGNMMKSNYFSEHFQKAASGGCKMEAAKQEHLRTIYAKLDPRFCSLEYEDFCELMRMHVETLVIALKLYFTKEETPEKIRESYRRRMRILCYGACPGQKQSE